MLSDSFCYLNRLCIVWSSCGCDIVFDECILMPMQLMLKYTHTDLLTCIYIFFVTNLRPVHTAINWIKSRLNAHGLNWFQSTFDHVCTMIVQSGLLL